LKLWTTRDDRDPAARSVPAKAAMVGLEPKVAQVTQVVRSVSLDLGEKFVATLDRTDPSYATRMSGLGA
jgi:hypothetical protein